MKNKLLAYSGGNFDGCIWEWNAAYWDADGIFKDIYSSGRDGLFSRHGCNSMFGRGKSDSAYIHTDPERTAREWLKDGENKAELIDLTRPKSIEYFAREWNSVFVAGVHEKLHDEYPKFFWICSQCGRHVNDETPILEDWHGCGGIASTADTMLCEECFSAGSCCKCNEYYGEDRLDHGYCEYCIENAIKQYDTEGEIERIDADLLHLTNVTAQYCAAVPLAANKAREAAAKLSIELHTRRAELVATWLEEK